MQNSSTKATKYFMVMTMFVFLVQGAPNALGPRIAAFTEQYPDVAYSTILLLQTIPNLMCIVSASLTGPLQKKIGLRGTLLAALILFMGGGMMPLLFLDNFTLILGARVIYGLGFGCLYTLAANLVIGLFEEKLQPRMMGLGTTFQTIGVMFFSLGGAIIASGSLDRIWFIFLIEAIPFIIALLVKWPETAKTEASVEKVDQPKIKEKIPASTWVIIIMFGFVGLFFNPIFLFASNIIVDNGFGTVTDASLLMTALAISGMVFAALYTAVSGKLSAKVTMVVGCIAFAIGNFIVAYANGMTMMYVGTCIIEWGFVWFYPSMTIMLTKCTPASLVPTANGLAVAVHNFLAFFTGNVLLWVMGLFGKGDDLQFAFVLAGGFFILLAVISAVFKPKLVGKENTENIEIA